jgi:dyslexia susceptibility 1 candidate gene 1 protein
MPLSPEFKVDESTETMVVTVILKAVKRAAIDVVITESFVKVSAQPYLFQSDLNYDVNPKQSHHRLEERANGVVAVIVTLVKQDPTIVWGQLHSDLTREERAARRQESMASAATEYNAKLEERKAQKESEGKRYFHEHWDAEKQQRTDIEKKVDEEKEEERSQLYEWQRGVEGEKAPANPKNVIFDNAPGVRGGGEETKTVVVDLTPKTASLPARTRGDEDFYRRARYKPANIQDTPMFWKEKGDGYFKKRDFKEASNAYSEALKRDACFVSCVANRAACWLMLHRYDRCVEDCDLALTMVNNTPASDTSGERYRAALMKLYARRGAGHLWRGDYLKALSDYQMAVAYRVDMTEHAELVVDLQTIQRKCAELGLQQTVDPLAELRHEADGCYLKGGYERALEIYDQMLSTNPHDYRARSNKCACLLHMSRFQDVIQETNTLLEFCAEVANAINSTDASAPDKDSDDEEGEGNSDSLVLQRRGAAQMIKEKSGHVYLLLKAYVRQGAAHCGMKNYHLGYECLERALRISPYDDDLRNDVNAVMEKMKLHAVIDMSKGQQPK